MVNVLIGAIVTLLIIASYETGYRNGAKKFASIFENALSQFSEKLTEMTNVANEEKKGDMQ